MDVWEHRALLCALVVLGCLCAGAVAAEPGSLEGDDGAPAALGAMDDATADTDAASAGIDAAADPVSSDIDGGSESDQSALGATQEADNETTEEDGDETTSDDGNETTEDDGSDEAEPDNETASIGPTPPGYDELVVDIDVLENGTAIWTLEYRYRLDGNDNASDRWTTVKDRIEENPEDHREQVEANWSNHVEGVSEDTGREMSAHGYEVTLEETTTPHETGTVQYRFYWEEFAHVELNQLTIGDAFGGFALDDRTQLIVRWPSIFEATSIDPLPDDMRDQAAIWNGDETDFLEDEPRIRLTEQPSGDEAAESEGESVLPSGWLGVGTLALVIAAIVAAWAFARTGWIGDWTGAGSESNAAGGGTEANHPDRGVAETPKGTVAGGVDTLPSEDLLSNEERVLKLLEEHGGRMKQQDVVATLDWTEAKTSQVVKGLRADGEIDAFRIGRENVLRLPEADDIEGEAADE